MLLNYGGNVGLHGKMAHVIDEFYKAKESPFGKTLRGVGMTMENCPAENTQQGTHESIFCARPSEHPYNVSSWSEMQDYYDPNDVIRAAAMLVSVADGFAGNNNFEYDLVDIVRQAIAEKGRLTEKVIQAAFVAGDKSLYKAATSRFLQLIICQNKLLATRPEFKLGTWINQARSLGSTPEEKDLYEWNARIQITTWGNRSAADNGGLRDYAHKEWNGILMDFYYMRWKIWFDHQERILNGQTPSPIDFYALEEPWTTMTDSYSSEPEGDCIPTVKRIFAEVFE